MKIIYIAILSALLITTASAQNKPDEILAKDAKNYIGKWMTVYDYDYRYEYRANKQHPDSAIVMIHLGKPAQFTLITHKLNLRDSAQRKTAESFRKISGKEVSDKTRQSSIGGYGRIFLFEGKPAMTITTDNLVIREPVEGPGWKPPGFSKKSGR